MPHNVTHASRHESCHACRDHVGINILFAKMTWLMLHNMTHASRHESCLTTWFLSRKTKSRRHCLHNSTRRNSYNRLIWGERLWLEKVTDFNNSSDVEIYPFQAPFFLPKKESTNFTYIPGITRGFTEPPGFRPSLYKFLQVDWAKYLTYSQICILTYLKARELLW